MSMTSKSKLGRNPTRNVKDLIMSRKFKMVQRDIFPLTWKEEFGGMFLSIELTLDKVWSFRKEQLRRRFNAESISIAVSFFYRTSSKTLWSDIVCFHKLFQSNSQDNTIVTDKQEQRQYWGWGSTFPAMAQYERMPIYARERLVRWRIL